MFDLRLVLNSQMAALVRSYGSFDAVAELFNARWGGGHSKGTISRKMAGHLGWTLADVLALEDAMARYPITRMLAGRLDSRTSPAPGNLITDSSSIARESGEAIAALLAAEQSSGAGDRAQAVAELRDVLIAVEGAIARLKDGGA